MTEPDETPVELSAEPSPGLHEAPVEPAEPTEHPEVVGSQYPVPAVESTRRLLGASFDLLTRTSDDMRRASFYIGLIVLGTVGPFALASFGREVVSIHKTAREMEMLMARGAEGWYGLLGVLAVVGVWVSFVESQTMAAAILGGHRAGRPITVRAALARSRSAFWWVVVGSFIVGIPVGVAQGLIDALLEAALGPQADVSLVSSALVAAVVGAPFAYLLSGIVLGDVHAGEATRRSFRVFRARKLAAAVVAVFATLAILLVVLGLSAGLDIALRIFDAIGLGFDSGPAGLTLVTIGIIGGVFAFGTLIYTALAISVAPQVVMFVGLTRATFGLDHVRPGGDRDPAIRRPGQRPFLWLTRPMFVGFVTGAGVLVGFMALIAR